MSECIKVYDVEAVDRCSREGQRVAVALSDSQIKTARRMGVSEEKLIAQTCAQACLEVLHIGQPKSLFYSLRCGDTKESTEMRSADEVRCPLSLSPQGCGPPLLCTLYACTPYSTLCYCILAAAESVLAEERPPLQC